MLTGSIVSSLQGIPRSTYDIDIVIEMNKDDIPKLLEKFPEERYYFSPQAIIEAVNRKDQFNVIDTAEGEKIDFWILTDSEFDRERFARRTKVNFMDYQLTVSSPEDTILQKLLWSRLSGGSIKQFNDAVNIYEIQYDCLDQNYLIHWANKLDIADLFQKLQQNAEV